MKTTDRIYSFVTEKLQEYGEMTFREIAELVKELLKDEYDEKQLHNCMQSLKKKGIVSRNSNNKYYLLDEQTKIKNETEGNEEEGYKNSKMVINYYKNKRAQLMKICSELDVYMENPLDKFKGDAIVETQKMHSLVKKIRENIAAYNYKQKLKSCI